jgi:aspartyl-tRNA(Asn)/glutamyl-tRNA(Gln) amidotransferase subunit A
MKMDNDEVCYLSAIDLADQIRSKRLSCVEVVQSFLERIKRIDGALHAYITVCEEEARREAEGADAKLARGEPVGPLHGVPFSVKDLFHTRGVRTTAGSRLHEAYIPTEDAIPVARLRHAGAILLGKTNTPEFGYKATTENPAFGPTHNPWSLELTPGGSSGGAAAATAAGISPLSLGSDGGGSIRIPASFCGVFGLKPSFGLIPMLPCFGAWRSLAHGGPITGSARDAALMLDVMAGPHERDRTSVPCGDSQFLPQASEWGRKLHIGYSPDLGFARIEPEIAQIVGESLPALETIGHNVERVDLDLSVAEKIFTTIVLAENTGAQFKDIDANREFMDGALVKFVEMGLQVKTSDYVGAMLRRDELAQRMSTYFDTFDLLVTSTVSVPPFPIDKPPRQIAGEKIDPLGWLPFTHPFNLTGHPAASVPCGWTSEGLPVGIQVVGPRYEDGRVLSFCAQYEEAYPWQGRRPALQ